MTREKMEFPNTFDEFIKFCGFKDDKEVYTNGSELIPVFRAKQWLDHIKPCENAVSREAVLNLIADYDLSMGQVVRDIHALPPVIPKQKTGKWLPTSDIEKWGYKCSVCGGIHSTDLGNYCMWCGAEMVETQESEE